MIATPDTLNVRQMIAVARALNPEIETVVRTHNEEEAALLEQEHAAGKVFLGEEELARAMTRYVLTRAVAGPGPTSHGTPVVAHV